jgi:hypothetical protein
MGTTRHQGGLAVRTILLVVLVAAGCRTGGPAAPHASLRIGAEPLRAQFNTDAGRTRVVVLAAPT